MSGLYPGYLDYSTRYLKREYVIFFPLGICLFIAVCGKKKFIHNENVENVDNVESAEDKNYCKPEKCSICRENREFGEKRCRIM